MSIIIYKVQTRYFLLYILLIVLGGLKTFEPWVSDIDWISDDGYSTVRLKCTTLEDNKHNCQSNPCQNNGTCYGGFTSFYCDCPFGFGGERCDIDGK